MIPALTFLRANWKLIGVGLLVTALAIQTWRLGNWREIARARGIALDQVAAVQKQQNERVIAWAKDIEAKSKRIADNADEHYQAGLADGRTATERFIADNRVRPEDRRCTVGAAPAAPSGSAPIYENTSADPVLASSDDIRICSALYDYAKGAHDWAASLTTPPR